MDEAALHDVIARVSVLLDLCPEITELDINPLEVLESGACAVDLRVRMESAPPRAATRRIEH